jgi:hypothetical protein
MGGNREEVGRESKKEAGGLGLKSCLDGEFDGLRGYPFILLGIREDLNFPLDKGVLRGQAFILIERGKEKLAGEVKDRTKSKLLIESIKARLKVASFCIPPHNNCGHLVNFKR